MSERERWVVYPLLFLALGAALRDKLVDRTTTKSIVCQELTVVEEEPDGHRPVRVLARIGRNEAATNSAAAGYLIVNGEVAVEGDVRVDGIVNANQFAMQGALLSPPMPGIGISFPDLLRALQAAQGARQPPAQQGNQPADQATTKTPNEGAAIAPEKQEESATAPAAPSQK